MIPKLRQGKYKISLKYLVIPESKKVLQTNTTDGGMSQGYRGHLGGALTVLVWSNKNTNII